MALHPDIDSSRFRVYSGFGQQLGPIVMFGAAGVIDGLAAIYPKTVVHLFETVKSSIQNPALLKQAQDLQFKVSAAEEFIVANGILGIREGIFRVLKMGNLEGGRMPLRGKLSEGVWENWISITTIMAQEEADK
jgi:2-keto-3-deoxy-L-rhamnonate aldolase